MKPAFDFHARLLVAFVGAVAVVLALALTGWTVAEDATDAAHQISRTHEVLTELARARVDTVQIELSTQNFRVSGDPARLAERDAAIAARELRLQRLKALTADDPGQQLRGLQLRQVINERLAIARRVSELRQTQGAEAANAFVAASPLLATRARTMALFDAMEGEETGLLAQRMAHQLEARRHMVAAGAAALVTLLLLLAGTWTLMRRRLHETEASREALAESEERSSTTLGSIGDAVIATDTRLRVTHMNAVAERLTGWSFEEARGRSVGELLRLLHEVTRAPAVSPVDQVLATGLPCEMHGDTVLIARDGSELPVADSAAPIRDRAGRLRGVVVVFRDEGLARQVRRHIEGQNRLLEERVAERTAQLADSESHLRGVINSVPAMIAYVDAGQRYGYANNSYLECFAPDQADVTGRTVHEVLGEARYAIARPMIERALNGESPSYDWEPFPGVWQLIHYAPKLDAAGKVAGYYVLGMDISERRSIEEALRASQQQLARVLDGAVQGYWDWNLQTNDFQVSARWETMLGYQPGEMLVAPSNWPRLVHPDDMALVQASIERHLQGQSPLHEIAFRARTKDGAWRWILTRGRIVQRADDGTPMLMSGTHTDIDERKQLELAQREAAVVFENCYEGIIVADARGLIAKVNPAFTRITSYTEAEVRGRPPGLLASGRHDARFYREFWQSLAERDFWHGEIWNRNKQGALYAALQSVSVVRDDKGAVQYYISVFSDISQQKAHESELDRVAHYDALTGLPNRRLLSDRLQQAVVRADHHGGQVAVCVLDLDGFKVINDDHGHEVGDQFLQGVARHVKSVLRGEDTLARLGGDEFVVLLADVGSAAESVQLLDRLLEAVQRPIPAGERLRSTSASIGVSLYPADHVDPDTLLRHADHAMLQAKQAGKNRYQLFDPEIDRLAQHRREQMQRLALALAQDEFVLHYQPKVDLVSGEVIGAEALIRWRHPERGLLPPGEFLPHLQASDLEQPLGEWVIEAALRQMDAWAGSGLDIPLSVNVSAHHLMRPDFGDRLAQALARHPGVPPAHLELEVLETAAIADMAQAVQILNSCRALGVAFSLDDFGTGYSSLTYLRQLPVQTLKIDQSFVRDMLEDQNDLSIVQGVIELAAAFHRRVIAEGVETLKHGAVLRTMGCRLVQGYGIARPMPAESLPGWCLQWRQDEAWRRF